MELSYLGCSALISSEIADLYLRYVIVVSKQDSLALCIFPVEEHIPFCVIMEFPSKKAVGSSYSALRFLFPSTPLPYVVAVLCVC